MKWWFPFKTLRTALVLTYLFLIASSVGLLAWRIGSSLDASRFAETQRDQEARSILTASAAEDWLEKLQAGQMDPALVQNETETLSREINQHVVVLDPRGVILADSNRSQAEVGDESKQPEVIQAMQGRPANQIRYDSEEQADVLYSIAPVQFERQLIGMVRLELPMTLVYETSRQFWLRIAGAALLAIVVTAIVSLLFARALSRPLGEITRAASALAGGDLKQRIHVAGPEELQKLAHGFNFMAERISTVMEDQRAFVANAAHELRTPLTTIRLRAEALSEGAKDDPQVATQFVADIVAETDRLARLVDELLDLSRIETGVVSHRREPVSIPAVAVKVAQDLELRAAEAGITIHVDGTGPVPSVDADPDQVRQVLINLIGNSIKFTPSGGEISVHTDVSKKPASEHLAAGQWLLTTVTDTGVGIPAADLPHIFQRFYRGDKARVRETANGVGGNAGLGLAIVKSIVERHGGQVWAESDPGQGTSITFALPIA